MIINSLEKTIQLKIIYYGPALSGKTTSLKALFRHFGKEKEVKSIESTVKRTLFFDYGTISFKNSQWTLKIHIYSTTGQDFYIVTRPVTLKAMDALIFVADSQQKTLKRNIVSWGELKNYLGEKLLKLPIVIAFNKQDLPDKYSPRVFLNQIESEQYKSLKTERTIAINGEGILHSFENLLTLIFQNLSQNKPLLSII